MGRLLNPMSCVKYVGPFCHLVPYLPEEGGFRSDFQKEELRHGSEATEPAANQLILPEVIVWTVTTELHNNKRHGHLLHKDLV